MQSNHQADQVRTQTNVVVETSDLPTHLSARKRIFSVWHLITLVISAFCLGILWSALTNPLSPLTATKSVTVSQGQKDPIDYGELSTETVEMAVDKIDEFQEWFSLGPYAQRHSESFSTILD